MVQDAGAGGARRKSLRLRLIQALDTQLPGVFEADLGDGQFQRVKVEGPCGAVLCDEGGAFGNEQRSFSKVPRVQCPDVARAFKEAGVQPGSHHLTLLRSVTAPEVAAPSLLVADSAGLLYSLQCAAHKSIVKFVRQAERERGGGRRHVSAAKVASGEIQMRMNRAEKPQEGVVALVHRMSELPGQDAMASVCEHLVPPPTQKRPPPSEAEGGPSKRVSLPATAGAKRPLDQGTGGAPAAKRLAPAAAPKEAKPVVSKPASTTPPSKTQGTDPTARPPAKKAIANPSDSDAVGKSTAHVSVKPATKQVAPAPAEAPATKPAGPAPAGKPATKPAGPAPAGKPDSKPTAPAPAGKTATKPTAPAPATKSPVPEPVGKPATKATAVGKADAKPPMSIPKIIKPSISPKTTSAGATTVREERVEGHVPPALVRKGHGGLTL